MSQPDWKCIANLGDVSPVDYGGLFVMVDETGVYPPEIERMEGPGDEDWEYGGYINSARWTIHRAVLDPCTYIDGILSDNSFHPAALAWFATTPEKMASRPQDGKGLEDVAGFVGQPIADLIAGFVSTDPISRAQAWRAVLDYHGWDNAGDPFELSHDEAEQRAERYLGQIDSAHPHRII